MMNHEQAVQTQASLRYALGELTEAERDAFEEHFADCANCMTDVETSTAFAANARAVFREGATAETRERRLPWFAWRPFPALAFSAVLNLVLVAGLGYGWVHFRSAPLVAVATASISESVEIVPIHGTTRGADSSGQVERVSGRPIVLAFDLPQNYEHYSYSVEREGAVVMSGEVKAADRSESLNLEIRAQLLPKGRYRVSATGTSGKTRDSLGVCLLDVEPK